MKTYIHKLTIAYRKRNQLFEIPIPRNAKSIEGIKITARDGEKFKDAPLSPTSNYTLGSIWLHTAGGQSNFFSQDLSFEPLANNQDSYNPIQSWYFESEGAWIHGIEKGFQPLSVPLKTKKTIEGYYENAAKMASHDSYEIIIYLKLAL